MALANGKSYQVQVRPSLEDLVLEFVNKYVYTYNIG